jgi:hypothetical protein
VDVEEVATLLDSEPTKARRIRAFGALPGCESGLGDDGLTMVGGSALDVYTEGACVSEAPDLVASDRARLDRLLRDWGFRSEGRYWTNSVLPLVVQIVGRNDSGWVSHSRAVSTRHGRVRLASVEDLVVKRLVEARHWRRPMAFAEALLALKRNASTTDWDYVLFIANKDGVADLALDARRRTEGDRNEGEVSELRTE